VPALLGWLAASRLIIAALGVIGAATFLNHHTVDVADRASALSLQSVWQKWDALWYERIALHGYGWEADDIRGQATAGFFPLYPVLVGVLLKALPFASFFWTATVFSNVLTFAALWLMATRLAADTFQGKRAIALTLTAAGSFYLSIPYTEGLFLLLIVLVMVLTRDRQYLWAAVVCGLAMVTRPHGVAVLAVPVIACWLDRAMPLNGRIRRIAAMGILAVIPLAIHMAHLSDVQGSADALISRQALWDNSAPYPFEALAGLFRFPGRLSGWLHGAFWSLYVGLLVRYLRRMAPGELLSAPPPS
jgi:Gpi18-like mannosyltransferase